MTKISQASKEEKIKVLAELDGWKDVRKRPHHPIEEARDMITGVMPDGCIRVCRRYLNDYNAIIPLIQKQSYEVLEKFIHILDLDVFDGWYDKQVMNCFKQTPLQLADALLIAIGKFTT